MEWKGICIVSDVAMMFLAFFMLVTGYGMTARFMERSMALLFHAGFEKWAFFAVLIIYFLVSELGTKSYSVLYSRKDDMRTWMGIVREVSVWGILMVSSFMVATGLLKDFITHSQMDTAVLILLIIHAFTGFWFYMKWHRKEGA